MDSPLKRLRSRIDRLDSQLVGLINERARIAGRIGDLKYKKGLPVVDMSREKFVLDRVAGLNPGPVPEKSMRSLFERLIEECRKHERRTPAGPEKNLPAQTVSVIGLGLIGSSICLALKKQGRCHLIGYDKKKMRNAGLVDKLASEPGRALAADVVFLAMPVLSNIEFLKRYAKKFRPGCLVMDVGSTKRRICERARTALPKNVFFVGGHPLAGKAVSKTGGADPDLFERRPFILTFDKKIPAGKMRVAKELVSSLGAIPVFLDAKTHDRVLAVTSHLPHMASIALALAAQGFLRGNTPLSGPAFLEMTRRALSDYAMWHDIVQTNKDFILEALLAYERSLGSLRRSLKSGRFRREFDQARRFRQNLG